MITQVAEPNNLPSYWRHIIQSNHILEFGTAMEDINDFYWYADLDENRNHVRGWAGAKILNLKDIFIGPCLVFQDFRGKGIQRQLIEKRLELGRHYKSERAVAFFKYKNYYSINNFIKCGFSVCAPWNHHPEDGSFLYMEKLL